MNDEPLSPLEKWRQGADVDYIPACWRAEILAARAQDGQTRQDHHCFIPGLAEQEPGMTREKNEPFSLESAWAHLGQLYGFIVALFGAPGALAARLMLVRKSRRDILSWLGPVEALARRLLLLKALALPPLNSKSVRRAAQGKLPIAFADRPAWTPAPDPAHWRVRFALLPQGALKRPDSRLRAGETAMPAGSRRTDFNVYPLARRLEALRRVLENPAPAIRRLAGLLAGRRGRLIGAFGRYRPRALPVRSALAAAQSQVESELQAALKAELALAPNTS